MPTPTTPPTDAPHLDVVALRRSGGRPPRRPAVAVPTKALHAPPPATGPVVAHLDPGQLMAGAELATIYSYGPSRVDTKVGDFSVFTGGGFTEPVLFLELWDQEPGTDVVVSIRILVGNDEGVVITATGNPIPMLLTGDATGGGLVTIHVPMTAGGDGYCAAMLEPQPPNGGFVWWSADFRHL